MSNDTNMRNRAPVPIVEGSVAKPRTGRELLQALRASGLVGMWGDRQDIGDSSDFARKLRERAQQREGQ